MNFRAYAKITLLLAGLTTIGYLERQPIAANAANVSKTVSGKVSGFVNGIKETQQNVANGIAAFYPAKPLPEPDFSSNAWKKVPYNYCSLWANYIGERVRHDTDVYARLRREIVQRNRAAGIHLDPQFRPVGSTYWMFPDLDGNGIYGKVNTK